MSAEKAPGARVPAGPQLPVGQLGPDRPGWRVFSWAMFAAGFATFALIFAPQAFLPTLSAQLGVSADTAAFTVSATTLGVAVGVLGWARVSDRIGRVPAMRTSLAAALVLAVLVPLLPTIGTVLAARFVEGVAVGAAPAVGMAYIAERVRGPAAARAAGTFVAGNTVGGITGRLASGAAADLGGWRLAFTTSTVIAAVAVAVFFLLIRQLDQAPPPAAAASARSGVVANLRDPYMVALYLQGFLLMGAFGVVYNFFGYHLQQEPFGLPAALTSGVFVVYLAGTLAARQSSVLAGRFGDTRAKLAGVTAMMVSFPLMTVESIPALVAGLILFTVGCFTAHPLASGMTGRAARTGRSQATALYQIAWLGGTGLFGWLGGIAFAASGWGAALAVAAVLSLMAGGVAVLGARYGTRRRPS